LVRVTSFVPHSNNETERDGHSEASSQPAPFKDNATPMLTKIVSFWQDDRVYATRHILHISAKMLISTPLFLLALLLLLRLLH
jgi:hypothetical protein